MTVISLKLPKQRGVGKSASSSLKTAKGRLRSSFFLFQRNDWSAVEKYIHEQCFFPT